MQECDEPMECLKQKETEYKQAGECNMGSSIWIPDCVKTVNNWRVTSRNY